MSLNDQSQECAVFLARGQSLSIVWANDSYLSMLPPPYYECGITGLPLSIVSPLGAVREGALLRVMHTGEPEGGEDRLFSVEDGTPILWWRAYRPLPDHVLVVIQKKGFAPEAG